MSLGRARHGSRLRGDGGKTVAEYAEVRISGLHTKGPFTPSDQAA